MRARGKGGDFCAVGGWANGKGRCVSVCVCVCVSIFASVHLMYTVVLQGDGLDDAKKVDEGVTLDCHLVLNALGSCV